MSNVGSAEPHGLLDRMAKNNIDRQTVHIKKKDAYNKESKALDDLTTKLTSLQTSFLNFDATADFEKRKVSISEKEDDHILTASAGGATLTGDYTVNVTRLATKTTRTGSSDVGDAINNSSDVSSLTISSIPTSTPITAGNFTVNGQQVTLATSDSLQDVFDAISTATSSDVTGSYDSATDKITLTSSSNIVLGSASDTSNFLQATQLYSENTTSVTSTRKLGAVDLDSTLSLSNLTTDVPSAGSFKINGESFSYDPSVDSLGKIINEVNASTAGVSIAYDAINDRFTATSNEEGNLNISVSDTSGNLLEAMGINSTATEALGLGAQYSINGGSTLNSSSNTFSSASHGIDGLTVTATKLGSNTLTVSQDSSEVRENLDSLIEKYNDVQSFLEENTKITVNSDGTTSSGPLTQNTAVRNLAGDLRKKMFDQVTGLTGDTKRLDDIGISFKEGSHELEIKSPSTLEEKLSKDIYRVASIFTDSTDGITYRFNTEINNLTKTDSSIDTSKAALDKSVKTAEDAIKKLQDEYQAALKKMQEQKDMWEALQMDMQRHAQMLSNLG